jgi:hypothetical protein
MTNLKLRTVRGFCELVDSLVFREPYSPLVARVGRARTFGVGFSRKYLRSRITQRGAFLSVLGGALAKEQDIHLLAG